MRHTNIVAAYLALIRGDRILLSLRQGTGYFDGNWSLVAGHLEPGETFTQAIIREAREEADIKLDPNDIEVVHIQHRHSDFDSSERVDVYFTAKQWHGEITNLEPSKCQELKWFPLDQLPPNMVAEVRVAIKDIKDKVAYAEFGW